MQLEIAEAYANAVNQRASYYVFDQGDFNKALPDLWKEFEIETRGEQSTTLSWPETGYWLAIANLKTHNMDGYRNACARMLEQFSDSSSPRTISLLAWTCALAPDAVSDFQKVVSAAEQAVFVSYELPSGANIHGAVLYRAGRLEDAVSRLTEANSVAGKARAAKRAFAWYFLAMAHHRLDHETEARAWLDKANQRTEEFLRQHKKDDMLFVSRRVTLNLIRREAEEMIVGDAEKLGDNE